MPSNKTVRGGWVWEKTKSKSKSRSRSSAKKSRKNVKKSARFLNEPKNNK